jgi:hypothetical protein
VEHCTTLHEEHLVVASEMEKEISFSPYSLQPTTVVQRYSSLAIVLDKEDI